MVTSMKGFQKALALLFAAATVFIQSGSAAAALTIEITQGERSGIPVAAVPFRWQGTGDPPEDLRAITIATAKATGIPLAGTL